MGTKLKENVRLGRLVCCFSMAAITKVPKLWGLGNRHLSQSAGTWKSRSECWSDCFLPRAVKETAPWFSPTFWWFAGSLWCSLVCRLSLISVFMSAWDSPWCKSLSTFPLFILNFSLPFYLILTWSFAEVLFPNKVTSRVLWAGTSASFGGDTIQFP